MKPRPDRRQFVFGGILIAGAGAAALARPPVERDAGSRDALARSIPERIGPYHYRPADDLVLPERDEDSLRIYQQYVARTYTADGAAPITMLVAYGASQDYALQVHRPESCYPMSGFAIGPSHRVPLRLNTARSIDGVALTASRYGREDQLLYWVRVADGYPTTLWEQRALMLRVALTRHLADGVLVRLSTPGSGLTEIAALAHFNALLVDSLGSYARQIILGSDATASGSAARNRA